MLVQCNIPNSQFIHATDEVANGVMLWFMRDAPVANLSDTDTNGLIDLERLGQDAPSIEPVCDCLARSIVCRTDTVPNADLSRRKNRGRRITCISTLLKRNPAADSQLPLGTNLPVKSAHLVSVGQQQRLSSRRQCIDSYPSSKGQGIKLTGDIDSYTIAGTFELQSPLFGPSPDVHSQPTIVP